MDSLTLNKVEVLRGILTDLTEEFRDELPGGRIARGPKAVVLDDLNAASAALASAQMRLADEDAHERRHLRLVS